MAPPRSVLLVRTFRLLKGGGPIPPTSLLYVAGALRAAWPDLPVRILDMGLGNLDAEELEPILRELEPAVVGLSTMSCEAELMHAVAAKVRAVLPEARIVVGGPHATVAWREVLADPNIDVAVLGEGEETVVELLPLLDQPEALATVRGIALRDALGEPRATEARPLMPDLDAAPSPTWDLVDLRAYRDIPTWNGVRKQPFHAPVVTSRGCPYGCRFCHATFGRRVRFRSAEHVFAELRLLHDRHGVREIHIVDDIFNLDEERAGRVCDMITGSEMRLDIAFPNGLRADIMSPELIARLERAGTYKIHFGFETSSPRLQELMGKKLDIEAALATFSRVAKTRIIAGAYFMLGLPTETEEEARATIACAVDSDLDAAYFFKTTLYPGTDLEPAAGSPEPSSFTEYHFHSTERSNALIPAATLNALLLEAQQRFWLRPSRLWRAFRKAPRKGEYLHSLLEVMATLLQAWLVRKIAEGQRKAPDA